MDSNGSIILGANAVGGIVGHMRGQFMAKGLSSNVTVNSVYRHPQVTKYMIYHRYNSKTAVSNNITSVSYAGVIAGIVDGYVSGSEQVNDTLVRTERIKYADVEGDVVVIGESVGFAFGYVGESTLVSDVRYKLTSASQLRGAKNNGGLVGENRGAIQDSYITYPKDVMNNILAQCTTTARSYKYRYYTNPADTQTITAVDHTSNIYDNFDLSTTGANLTAFAPLSIDSDNYVSAGGVVGFNNGGSIYHSYSTIVIKNNKATDIGGLVGFATVIDLQHCLTTSSVYGRNAIIGGAVARIVDPHILSNAENSTVIVYTTETVAKDTLAGYNLSTSDSLGDTISMQYVYANNLWETSTTSLVFSTSDRGYSTLAPVGSNYVTDVPDNSASYNNIIGALVGCLQGVTINVVGESHDNIGNNVTNSYMPLAVHGAQESNDVIRIAVYLPAMHMYYDSNVSILPFIDLAGNTLTTTTSELWKTSSNDNWSYDKTKPEI